MKTYDVSLNFIVSDVDKLARLKKYFVNSSKVVFNERILDDEVLARIEPNSKDEESALDQIAIIANSIDFKLIENDSEIYEHIYVDIVVYYTSYTCSVSLSSNFIQHCLSIHPLIDIDLTCYPTEEE